MPLLEQANRINNIMQICYSIFNKNNQIYMFEKKTQNVVNLTDFVYNTLTLSKHIKKKYFSTSVISLIFRVIHDNKNITVLKIGKFKTME